jgi:hypothetical protein
MTCPRMYVCAGNSKRQSALTAECVSVTDQLFVARAVHVMACEVWIPSFLLTTEIHTFPITKWFAH